MTNQPLAWPMPRRHPTDFVRHLRELATLRPNDRALIVARDEDGVAVDRVFSYRELDARVRALAARLQRDFAAGERALIMLDNSEHYVVSFFACCYAGLIAVPVFPPESTRKRHLGPLEGIAADAGARCILTQGSHLPLLNEGEFSQAQAIAVDALGEEGAERWCERVPSPADIAFLQYTSGSTSAPKGVMVTHGALMANMRAIEERLSITQRDVFVTWLPLNHDMGLIGGLLQPIHRGIPVVLMSPRYFLERPLRWLQAISRHRATISGGPDFSYRLCCERITPQQMAALDLSSWAVAFSGAEPVRADTLQAFIAHAAPAGFQAHAVYPCYGLAEATLLVTGGTRGGGLLACAFATDTLAQGQAHPLDGGEGHTVLVGCGSTATGHQVRITDPASFAALSDGRIGEIWSSGPSIARGYWARQEASQQTFVERDGATWLRTGDLGFLHGGQLHIAGRIKDMIIVRGHNLYPQDLERAVEAEVDAVRKGRVAAFAVEGARGEGIGLAVEVSRSMQKLVRPEALVELLSATVSEVCGEPLSVVLLLNPGGLPKTTSGKLQRQACRKGWLDRSADAYAIYEHGRFIQGAGDEGRSSPRALAGEVEQGLAALWREVLRLDGPRAFGPESHFFVEGGNSLAAVQLVARIRDQWGADLSLRALFEQPRLREMASEVKRWRDTATREPAIQRADRNEPLPLSHAQRSLWLTWRLDPACPAYNLPGTLRCKGALDAASLQHALQALVGRHEVLRTLYVERGDGQAEQRILADAPVALSATDLRLLANRETALQEQLQAFARLPFQLDVQPPVRAALWQLADDEHVLGLSLHHIACDGQSIGILVSELLALYAAQCEGRAHADLPLLAIQVVDHAVWQRGWFDAGERQRQLDHGCSRLGSEHAPIELPLDRPRGGVALSPEGRVELRLSAAVSQQMRELARMQGASLFMVMLAVLKLTLHRFSGQRALRVGVPMANRQRPETARLIGCLTQVQVLATQLDPRSGFNALLASVRSAVLDAQAHPDLPFDLLVDALWPERQPGVHPLFQVKCTQQDDFSAGWQGAGLAVQLELLSAGIAHFDLSLDFIDRAAGDAGIDAAFAYASALFDEVTVQRIAEAFASFADQVSRQPEMPLAQLGLAGAVSGLRGPQTELPLDVLDAWSHSAARHPQRVAVRQSARSFTFAEMDAHTDALAARLAALGVKPETRVAVHAERSCEFVLGVLAVLKAGGAYVPLDPQLPADRLAYQLADSGAQWLLTEKPIAWPHGLPTVALAFAGVEVAFKRCPVHPQQTAYVIYTSGSTGRPKGVAVGRGALANYVQAVLSRLQLPDEVDSLAMVSTVAADLGHTSFFGALCSGRSLHLIGTELAFDPDRFAREMAEQRVGVLKVVPSHLQALLQAANAADALPAHTLVVGGEATPWRLLDRIRELKPACRVLNHYGPTEATVGALTQAAETASRAAATLPLGQPLANVQALVLDDELNAVPRGVAGQLYLGGVGLATGYLGRPGLSAERFVAHPANTEGQRLYRSGDRVRQLPDGSLEFLGRADDQVKVRGYRVELGEVRAALLAQAQVGEAELVVGHTDDGRAQLHGYVVPQAGVNLDLAMLRAALAVRLPDYMLPATLTPLAALPLTPNGKLDRKRLPAPEQVATRGYDAPQGETEAVLASVWAEVLRLERVGRHDNFFELGGDSILTLQIIARARKRGVKLSPRQLMEHRTVAQIAAALHLVPPEAAPRLEVPVAQEGGVPLTPIQQWFFQQPLAERHHWNQSVLLQLGEAIDEARLRQALQALVERHDALRLSFIEAGGAWRQTHRGQAGDAWQLQRGQWHEAAADEAQRSLNLGCGPVLAARLIDGGAAPNQLLLVAHHLVVDAVSWRVLIEDLHSLYTGAALPPASASFADWSRQLNALGRSDALNRELSHWSADRADPLWPARDAAAPNTVASARHIEIGLDAERTALLLRPCTRPYRMRVDELLLSALARSLCDWTGLHSVRIELEGHGREDLFEHLDLSRSVGWFTTLYPVRLRPAVTLPQTLTGIKEQLRAVPQRGLGHGVLRYLSAHGESLAQAQPCLTFNHLGRIDTQVCGDWALATDGQAGEPGTERAPQGQRRAWFEVITQVQDGRLHITWAYSNALHDEAEVRALAHRFEAALNEVIDHCSQPGVGALTPSDVPLAGLTQPGLDALKLKAAEVQDVYPLAPMQQGLLLHTLLNAGAGMYLMQDHYRFDSDIDVAAFTQAWDRVVERHELLRTGFAWQAERLPLQVVYARAASPVQVFDWSALDALAFKARLDEMMQEELANGFDLARPPLMRLRLIRRGERAFHLVQSFHHVLMDAWCRSLLLTDFFAHYEALLAGRSLQLAQPRRYRDFIAWLQQQDGDAARAFWRAQLEGFDTATPLPWRNDRQPSAQQPAVMTDVVTHLTADDTALLQQATLRSQVTLNTFVQAAWALVLARLGSVGEVLFGVTVAGRPLELDGIQDTVGLFINTIPLRVALPEAHTPVGEWLRGLLSHNLAMRQHEHLSLVEIQALSRTHGAGHSPDLGAPGSMPRGRGLFDSLFVFENAPLDAQLLNRAREMGVALDGNRTHTNYPLTVVVVPGERLMLQLTGDGRQFEDEGLQRLLACFRHTLLALAAQPEAPLSAVRVMPAELQRAALARSHGPEVAHPLLRGYAELFEGQVLRHGERTAVRCLGQGVSYSELNARANRVGHLLREHGVGRDTLVALGHERGLDLHAMMLGTLKAGAAYLVLDAKHPPQRLARVIEASGARVLLASPQHAAQLQAAVALLSRPPAVLVYGAAAVEGRSARNLGIATHPDGAAYAIYTSGSTGEPKGVLLTLRGMLNNQLSKIPRLQLSERDVIAQTASPSFDISVWQSLAGLLCGACIEVVPDAIARDPRALPQHVADTGITVLQSVPAMIHAVLDEPAIAMPTLRWLLPTGEASTTALARRWFVRYPSVPLINAYGPAECADDVSLQRLDALGDGTAAFLPVGPPVDNTQLLVLGADLELLPAGVAGELYVAGVGVGRGYLGRPGLSAERFVAHPHATTPGQRLYRTGDLARCRDDGVIECLGRVDQQVKLRGLRIELGEIEAQLARINGVKEAAVGVHDAQGARHLVAYVVPQSADEAPGWREHLAAALGSHLPDYMLPTRWLALAALPRTPNGKLDRKALPVPEAVQREHEPPQGELETQIAAVWAEVLGQGGIGRTDNFFELGGHSLSSMQVTTRLQTQMGMPVPMDALFKAPTLRAFALALADTQPGGRTGTALQSLDSFMDSLETA